MTETNEEKLAPRTISLSILPSARARMPEPCTFYWDYAAKRLRTHEERKEKDGLSFIAALFHEGRGIEPDAVREVTALVGDFHGVGFDQIKNKLQALEIEFVAYSTFYHSRYFSHFRIFVPLEKNITPGFFRMIWPSVQRELFLDSCERHADDMCTAYLFPACHKRSKKFSFHSKGRFYMPSLDGE